MTTRKVVVAALIAASGIHGASAAITNVNVAGITNTQAILQYTAPDTAACSVDVSESSTLQPLVNDVDPAKFPGADLDSRSGAGKGTRQRVFVIGKRAAEAAADNLKYSRALQVLTPHYGRIRCASTGDSTTFQFTTSNLMMGSTHTDTAPVDKQNPGDYAWPTINWADRTQKIVDPQTGLLIRRVDLPGDSFIDSQGFMTITRANGAGWQNAQAATAGPDGVAATVTADNTSTLFAGQPTGYFDQLQGGFYGGQRYSLNYFSITLSGQTSRTSCSTDPSQDDCKVVLCLTLDGVSCYAGSQSFERALTPSAATYVVGSKTAGDLWQSAGTRPPNLVETNIRGGSMMCDGSTSVSLSGGDYFNTVWSSGTTVTVDGLPMLIGSVANIYQMVLQSPCTAGTHNWTAIGFGVLIRKKTASSDTVSIDSILAVYELGVLPAWPYSGAYDISGATPVTGPTSQPGYNFALPGGGLAYWIDRTSGEAHLWGRAATTSFNCGALSMIFDAADPDTFYCGGNSLARVKYIGDHLEPRANMLKAGAFAADGGDGIGHLPQCTKQIKTQCVVITPLTPGTDLLTLTHQFDVNFQADRFQNIFFNGMENGHMHFLIWRSDSNTLGWQVLFDPNASTNGELGNSGCVGNGVPGCIVAAKASWRSPNSRWCNLKAMDPINTRGWVQGIAYYSGNIGDTRAGGGPFQVTVNDGSSFPASNFATCPVNSFGVTGNSCLTVTIASEPFDASPCLTNCPGVPETGAPGEFGNAAPGDTFNFGNNTGDSRREVLRLLVKNGNRWTFQRSFNGQVNSTGSNPTIYTECGAAYSMWYWNYTADPHATNYTGATVVNDSFPQGAHDFWQNNASASGYTLDTRCKLGAPLDPGHSLSSDCYQTRGGPDLPTLLKTAPVGIVETNPWFSSNRYSYGGVNEIQEHPSGMGSMSPPETRSFFLDGRPFKGGYISGPYYPGGKNAVAVGGQLYKFDQAALGPYMDRKFLETFAFAGWHPLLDISSASKGDLLGTGSADSYKYCVAVQADECRLGSQPGDFYINAPHVSHPYCYVPAQNGYTPEVTDLCVSNNPMQYNSIMQMPLDKIDNWGTYMRMLSKGLGANRMLDPFWSHHALPDSSWLLTHTAFLGIWRSTLLAIKLPPPPALDGLNRGDFIPIPVALKPNNPAVDNAVVEFGYAENGPPEKLFCTSRLETCAVGKPRSSAPIDTASNPFYFETSEAQLLAGVPCQSGCSVTVPGLSQRIVYTRYVYRDANNAVLYRGPLEAVAVP